MILERERSEGGVINETTRLSYREGKIAEISSKVTHDSSSDTISNISFNFNFVGKEIMIITMVILSILLTLNMILVHSDKIVLFYNYMYKKFKKPKFKVGELVLIDDIEFQVILISSTSKPYTYFCLPLYNTSKQYESYFHESRINKKTGLLKELE